METVREAKIGELLLRESLLTPFQLQKALQIQKESRERCRLGEVISRLGYISRKRLAGILRKYHKGILMGQLLLDAGLITEEKLDIALAKQAESGKRLGEVLLELGFVMEGDLAKTLAQQLNLPYILPDARTVDRNVFRRVPPGFAESQAVIPMYEKNGVVTVVGAEPLPEAEMDHLRSAVGAKVQFAIGPASAVKSAIERLLAEQSILDFSPVIEEEPSVEERVEISERRSLRLGGPDQTKDILDFLLFDAYERKASDVHIEALPDKLRVRYRIDGVLVPKIELPRGLLRGFLNRLKSIARLETMGRPKNQEGYFAARIGGQNVDMRVSVFNALHGENVTIKMYRQLTVFNLDRLGIPPATLEHFKEMLKYPAGVIVLAGTGDSGKTTTLYASIEHLNDGTRKIVTMESPVERTLSDVVQTRIDNLDEAGVRDAFEEVLHQDPDIIVVGDIRGRSVAAAIMEEALAGQKVIATLNASNSVAALYRLLKMGVEPHLLASSVSMVLSQRLVRVLCEHCREMTVPESRVLDRFEFKDFSPDDYEFFASRGCEECGNAGYKGRTGIFELLLIRESVRRLIADGAAISSVLSTAVKEAQFVPMKADGFLKALDGKTTLDEVLRVCPSGVGAELGNYSIDMARRLLGWEA